MQSDSEAIKAVIREFHAAIERRDTRRIDQLLAEEVFVLGAPANAVFTGRDELIADLQTQFDRVIEAQLHVKSPEIHVGLCDSGRSAWFFDQFFIDILRDQDIQRSIPIRLTGLLERDQAWQLVAAYWSIPLRSNDYQLQLLQAGKIPAGNVLAEQVPQNAQPLAQRLKEALALPKSLPELQSTREDAILIGSTVDEVFQAAAGKDFVQEIASLPLQFTVRGGVRGAVAADGCTAWMATHVDLKGRLTMPYRFFYIWLREQEEWKIVLWHDAVSIDPADPGFEIP